ncbi:MAG: SAM-dependent methyltransferase [Rhodospirillaceae bacterium]|nr:SAM-dependent methyltransferase [Rhodospirillaceae bacterium]
MKEFNEIGVSIDLVALGTVLVVIGLIFIYALRTGISPMPSSAKVRRTMFDMLPDHLEGTVFELGSGWGTLALPLARRYPNCPVRGYEISPLPWLYSWFRGRRAGQSNLKFLRRDYLSADLSSAAMVVVYIHADGMAKLKPKFEAELKPGTLVLSNFFQVRSWTPVQEITADDLHRSKVYLYQI